MDDVPILVAEDLKFDVSRPRQILLDVHVAVAERGQCLRPRELERARKIIGIPRDAHAFAAAAGGRLDNDGKADGLPKLERSSTSSTGPGGPGTIGPPTSVIALRAPALSPITRIWSAVGPMKSIFDAAQMSANSAFSARKP